MRIALIDEKPEYPSVSLWERPWPCVVWTPPFKLDLNLAAFHEAGHFIVSLRRRHPVAGAEIFESEGGVRGCVYLEGVKRGASIEDIEDSLEDYLKTDRADTGTKLSPLTECSVMNTCVVLAAGRQAELILHGRGPLEGMLHENTYDSKMIRHMLWRYFGRDETISGRIFYAQRYAYALLTEYWHEMQAMAEALLERRHLTKAEGLQIISEAGPLVAERLKEVEKLDSEIESLQGQ